jgi:hypothetical protein
MIALLAFGQLPIGVLRFRTQNKHSELKKQIQNTPEEGKAFKLKCRTYLHKRRRKMAKIKVPVRTGLWK